MTERSTIAAFYTYLVERERIRLKKEAGLPWPWTEDPILREYKFTNVRRDHDRTTRFLVENFYKKPGYTSASARTCLMNCAIFRYHGTMEFARAVGWSTKFPEALDRVQRVARQRLDAKQRVFTGAYMITNMKMSCPKEQAVRSCLEDLWRHADRIVRVARHTRSWADTAEQMCRVRGFSGFMTKEVLLDTMYTNLWPRGAPDDRDTWTPIGPGASRGLDRIFGKRCYKHHPKSTIQFVDLHEVWEAQGEYWPSYIEVQDGSHPQSSLSMHDVQFGLCEFDKYERTRLGQGRPRSRYHVKS